MEEKHPVVWTSVTNSLEVAALRPHQRDEMISRALQQLHIGIPIIATALIWPCRAKKVPWKVYYTGIKPNVMHRWLSARLDPSLDVTVGMLQHDLIHSLADMPPPLLIRLATLPSSPGGIWIVWLTPSSASSLPETLLSGLEPVRQMLEAVLEVEDRETQYFSASSPVYDRELIESLVHDDAYALSAFLTLARVVAKADLAFWAKAYDDVLEVTSHLGAKHSGFGFSLPRGQGMGGRVLAYGKLLEVSDYRNYSYRDPSVCEMVDDEQLRSGLALPVYYHMDSNKESRPVSAVLYTTRRAVAPFSLAERLLMQRQAQIFEQVTLEKCSRSFFLPGIHTLPEHKAAWHDLILHANRLEAVEAWASQLIKGTVIVTNNIGSPYVLAHSQRLEDIQASGSSQPGKALALSLAAPGVHLPGQVYLCPSIPLPPPQWPDFFADLVVSCNVVIARMERTQDQLDRQREQWLHALLKEKMPSHVEQDGYRLGLPIEHGQLWVLAWPHGTIHATKSVRNRMAAETVVLDCLKSPLMFFEDTMAVVLLEGQAPQKPSQVRDALLKHCGPHPLWIVHSGHYHSLHELKTTLSHMISLAQKARREGYEEYLLDIYTFGLDSLLENPTLAKDLDTFAKKLLTPLIEYDAANSSHLTETFVLAQTLGSAQAVANQLGVHVNTIRYRLHRAEDILGADRASPKEQAAMSLAAFTWLRFHTTEQTFS
ncbi:MAG TPA: helix-turn-helix domain-containing protein [Ktedonosporobacter sp.]|nr:helix-turn-helix domain-containing protein [Ktedonosporobacter sp.]